MSPDKPRTRPDLFRPLRAREILIFWLAAFGFWEAVFSQLKLLPDIRYLAYPATAWTLIVLTKRTADEQISLGTLLGKSLARATLPGLFICTALTIATGFGGWALQVFIEASINPERTFRAWRFMSAEAFETVNWSYSWVAIELMCGAIVAPIMEEIVFRGVLQKALLKRYSLPRAILYTALIFSLFHLDKSLLSSFLHSVLYSIVAIRLSSLYAAMLVHGFYNLTTTILRTSVGLSLVVDKGRINAISYWLPEFSLLAVALLICIVWTIKSRGKLNEDHSVFREA